MLKTTPRSDVTSLSARRSTKAADPAAAVAAFSRSSAEALRSRNTFVGDFSDTFTLSSLRDAMAKVVALDEHVARPKADQLRALASVQEEIAKMDTGGSSAAASFAFMAARDRLVDYVSKRQKVVSAATNDTELRELLAALNHRAVRSLSFNTNTTLAATSMMLSGLRDSLTDYVKQAGSLLIET